MELGVKKVAMSQRLKPRNLTRTFYLDTKRTLDEVPFANEIPFVGRQNLGKGGLTQQEISILKKAVKNGQLTKAEFDSLQLRPDPGSSRINDNWYGVVQRENRPLFTKVRKILEPGIDLTARFGQLYSNEKVRNYIIKEVNKGKSNAEIIEGLKKFKITTPVTSNRISSLVASLPEIKEEFKRVPGTGRTVEVEAARAKKVMDIINNSIKNKVPIPSLSEIAREVGFKTYSEVGKIIQKEKGEKFYKKFFKNMQDKQKARILKLANNGKVVQALGDGTILNEKMTKYVAKLLKQGGGKVTSKDMQIAGSTLFDLKEAYAGNKTYIKPSELPKIRATKGFNLITREAAKDPFNNPLWNKVRVSRESQVSKAIGEGKNVLDAARRKITKAAKPLFEKLGLTKKGVSVATDELANVSTSAQYGGEGYSVYQQVLTKTGDKTKDDFNLQKAKQLDRKLVDVRKKIVQGIVTPEDIEDYNTSVKKIVSEINENVPKGAKRLEAITIVPGGNPLQTVSGIDKLKTDNPVAYQNIIDDANKYNVSYNIPKSVESIYTIGDKPAIQKRILDTLKKAFNEYDEKELIKFIKNKTPKQIKEIFKAIPRVADVSQDDVVRFASANNIMSDAVYVDDEPESFVERNPITTTVGATALGTGAAAATKKGRAGLKYTGGKLLQALKILGTPGISSGYAASEILDYKKPEDASFFDRLDPRNYEIQEDPNIKIAGGSLLLPEVAKGVAPTGRGILSTLGRFALNPYGRFARAFTPVGLATIGVGMGKDVYDEYKRREALTDEERLAEDLEAQEKFDETMIGAAEGGRIGFADGPEDPSKRTFLKIMGGLASLPILGKFFKKAEQAAPVVSEGVKLGFDNFMKLVKKIKMFGEDVSDTASVQERQKVIKYQGKDGSEYELVEDITTGDIIVQKDKPGVAVYGRGTDDVEGVDVIEDRSVFSYKKGEEMIDTKTGKGVKAPDEYDEMQAIAHDGMEFDDVDVIKDKAVKEVLDEID